MLVLGPSTIQPETKAKCRARHPRRHFGESEQDPRVHGGMNVGGQLMSQEDIWPGFHARAHEVVRRGHVNLDVRGKERA